MTRSFHLVRDLIQVIRSRGLLECAQLIWNDFQFDSFDRDFAVETRKDEVLMAGDIVGNNLSSCTFYRPVRPWAFRALLLELKIDLSLGFVDYGAGKGRAMILAAEYGFKKITGIEFSHSLFQTAGQNLHSIQGKFVDTKFQLILGDVCDFLPEASDSVFFFYDPFDFLLVEQCLGKIKTSWEKSPREILIIYHNNLRGLDSIRSAWAPWLELEQKSIHYQNFYIFRSLRLPNSAD